MRRIACEQLRSSINQQLIKGRFGHEGLRQLCTNFYIDECSNVPLQHDWHYLYELGTANALI